MLAFAEHAALKPDARVHWLVQWIKRTFCPARPGTIDALIIFTEWEDTRRWLERRLREALAETDQVDDRIAVFTGTTGQDRREEVKAAFNADPAKEPLRILICTDAAREGINLQTYCSDLIHFDLPWNPSRLEQRNGRIDRKLQPAKQVFCRYFRYEQREADIVLEALVRKTEVIQRQLGSAGQVIEKRITDRLARGGIDRGAAAALAKAIEEETDAERLARARAEMDDEERARYARVAEEQQELRDALERSRERVGVSPDDLQRVVSAALARAGFDLDGDGRKLSAILRLTDSILTIQHSPRNQAGRTHSTICASVRGSAASGSANGASVCRSGPSRLNRRACRTAATRQRLCRSISSTAWCVGYCRAFFLRVSRQGCHASL